MSTKVCPTRNCINPVPKGPQAVFCADCHFRLPYRATNQIFALQFACQRADDPDIKQHLREQIDAHIRSAAHSLENANAA